jgi:SAM-dependent methyltransferase
MIPNPFRRDLLRRLQHKFFSAPAGFGRPLPQAVLDHEYSSGAWAHFNGSAELSRQVLVAGTAAELHPHPSVLDIGCGGGRLAQLFQPFQCHRYLGVDLSAEGISRAKALNLPGCEFVSGDFETWRPSETFDVILFSECVGYARDPGQLTASFVPFLTPGGHIIISHFRFGHWAAHWRRIERELAVVDATTVINRLGQTWDIKILEPRRGA